jgi:lipoate-protein ligase A
MDAAFCFALEYDLATRAPCGGETVFLFWRTVPTLMVGRFQNIYAEIDLAYARAQGIQVTRRLSGGGAIYTDPGSWQFTFIAPQAHAGVAFAPFVEPVLRALRGLGVDARFSGRNDLLVGDKKCCGNAQYIKNGRVVHHGSILFDADIGQMARATTVDAVKIAAKGVASVRDRVINLAPLLPGMTGEGFRDAMVAAILGDGQRRALTPAERAPLAAIAQQRFRAWAAVYGQSPACGIVRKARFPGGTVEAHVQVDGGRIADIALHGDFFGAPDMAALRATLQGCPYEAEAVRARLAAAGQALALYGITPEDVASVIV